MRGEVFMRERITACFLCGCNCGLIMYLDDNDRIVKITGDKDNPRTKGFACIKGLNQGAQIDSPHRLTKPLKREVSRLVEVSWDEALDGVAQGLNVVIKKHGTRSLGMALGGSGHSTMQVMLAYMLIRALGSRNAYSPVGLELTSKYLANQKLYGASFMDGHPNMEEARFALLIGTNPVISWPQLEAALKEISADCSRTLAVIDPRLTETGRLADIHSFIRPSTCIYFVLALLNVIITERLYDDEIVRQRTRGLDDLARVAKRFTPEAVEQVTGIQAGTITRIARGYADANPGVILYDMGVIADKHSTLVSYIINIIILITGNATKKRGSLFNPTLLDNNKNENIAFGGKIYTSRVRPFKEITGFMPVTILADEILTPGKGQIRGMIVSGCNPLRSYGNSSKMERAFRELDFLVSIDPFLTEVGRLADYVLPVCSFHEQDNISFGFPHLYPTRFVQLIKPVRPPLGESRPEWMIYRDILRRVGVRDPMQGVLHWVFELGDRIMGLRGKPEIDRQTAMLRLMARAGRTSYAELEAHPHGLTLSKGKQPQIWDDIKTGDKRACLNAPEFLAAMHRLVMAPPALDPDYPLLLNTTCRTKANMNTLYRNEKWIEKNMPENTLTMHAEDAAARGITDKERVRISSRNGSAEVPVSLTTDILPGTVFLSHGWGLYSRDPQDRSGTQRGVAAGLFVSDEDGDEFSGMPLYNGIPCSVTKLGSR